MKKVVFVVSGGELGDPAFFRQQAAVVAPVAVICADGGARHLDLTGIAPNVVVGDMDSLDAATLANFATRGCRIVRHPVDKDETDTELALLESLAMGPDEVWIWGALGFRVDHLLANISLLGRGRRAGVEVRLIDSWCEVFLIEGRAVIAGTRGQTVSLFPFAGPAAGVTLTGFEYPLTKALLEIDRPLGVSNRLVAGQGIVEVDSGRLLVVRYFQPGVFPGEVKR